MLHMHYALTIIGSPLICVFRIRHIVYSHPHIRPEKHNCFHILSDQSCIPSDRIAATIYPMLSNAISQCTWCWSSHRKKMGRHRVSRKSGKFSHIIPRKLYLHYNLSARAISAVGQRPRKTCFKRYNAVLFWDGLWSSNLGTSRRVALQFYSEIPSQCSMITGPVIWVIREEMHCGSVIWWSGPQKGIL
jgi:hypothetical protein